MNLTVIVLAFSVVSVAAGTTLLIATVGNQVIAGGMISAAVGGFWRELHVAKKREAAALQERDELQEETQQLRTDLFEVTGVMKKPKKRRK